ncbi:MAG: galactose mutarotase [Lachnospiraceae bacterium]|nr:galactose mutarotase [Lachnospiraceae bacterium]
MSKKIGATRDGADILRVKIKNKNGMSASIMNYGAILLKLILPDGLDVVLGYDKIEDYLVNEPYYGCTVAPNANRIAGGAFDINGKHYEIEKNDHGHNNLHSGNHNLAKKIWQIESEKEDSVTLSYDSSDMEMGFPGNCHITVTYTLTDDNALILDYTGTSDADTIFNPTNHSYFNLNGPAGGNILEHRIRIDADSFTPADDENIPNGAIRKVTNTPLDFTSFHTIGERIEEDCDTSKRAGEYDNNFCLNQDTKEPEFSITGLDVYFAATVESPASDHRMDVYTSLPGLQLYVGDNTDPNKHMKGGKGFSYAGGIALESQYFPNAINIPKFESPILKAGETNNSRTVYKFSKISA